MYVSKCEIRKDGRTCNRCAEFQAWDYFWKDNREASGYGACCKKCANNDRNSSRAKKKVPIVPKSKKPPVDPEILKQRKKEYGIKYREANREHMKVYFKTRYSENREKFREYQLDRQQKGCHKFKVNKRRRERLQQDDFFRFKTALRNRLRLGFKTRGLSKTRRTIEYIGMSYCELRAYIEDKFLPGMAWDNYGAGEGKWSLDHILPLNLANTQEDLLKLCHYTNLQPLWSIDNIIKGSKVPAWYKKAS